MYLHLGQLIIPYHSSLLMTAIWGNIKKLQRARSDLFLSHFRVCIPAVAGTNLRKDFWRKDGRTRKKRHYVKLPYRKFKQYKPNKQLLITVIVILSRYLLHHELSNVRYKSSPANQIKYRGGLRSDQYSGDIRSGAVEFRIFSIGGDR